MTVQPVPPAGWRLHVVPHTHWDREWYAPLEFFRVRLAHTVDEVLDVLERDPRMCFTLDGQSVLLEDYAEYRPGGTELRRLRALAAEGRLVVGPAYVQPDEFLVGGESLVRNLLVGMEVCRRFGVEPAPIGYAPDTFGHVAQMPQILRGFGLDHCIFARGWPSSAPVAWWEAPDGSRVFAVALIDGYDTASSLGVDANGRGEWVQDSARWPDAAAARVQAFLARRGDAHRALGLRDVLLCNGVDHRRIQRNLPEILAACEQRVAGTSMRICRFQDYVETLRAQVAQLDLEVVRGELLSGRFLQITRSVNSTRSEIKLRNAAVERLLLSSEALAALACMADVYDYPLQELELAWRSLMRAHPHDSICGCSIDRVHRDMAHRFDRAGEVAERIGQEALAALAGEGRDAVWHWAGAPRAERTLVNVLPWPRRCSAALALPGELARATALVARSGADTLPVQVRDGLAIVVADLPALGSLPITLAPGRAEPVEEARAQAATIENGTLRVDVAGDGSMTLVDRVTGTSYAGQHVFEDVGDRGDEYSFCPLDGELPRTSAGGSARVRAVQPGPLVAELEVRIALALPARLARDRRRRVGRAVCEAVTRVRLTAGIDRVELSTRLVNRASDHRLRVVFDDPAGDPARIGAESAFAVVRRPARPPRAEDWFEPPTATGHTAGLVCAGELVVVTRGLQEYEAIPRDGGVRLAITLVRAVGWLSRPDLSTRRGNAGPATETPDAQGLGEHRCEYALGLRRGRGDAELVRGAQDYRFEVADGPGRIDLQPLVTGAGFAASALKGAQDGRGAILRVFNPGAEPGWIEVAAPAERCRLDEGGGTPVTGRLEIAPYEIVTLRILRP